MPCPRATTLCLVAGAVAVVTACAHRPAPPPTPSSSGSAPIAQPAAAAARFDPEGQRRCREQGIVLEITPPAADDARGRLKASFAGQGMGLRAERICLVHGGRARLVDGPLTAPIRAHPTALQRLIVDGQPLLVHVPPGGTLKIAYHPCANWVLVADWLDDGLMGGHQAIYRRTDADCPAGFVDGGKIVSATDPRCGNTDRCPWARCVRAATLRLAAPPAQEIALRAGADTLAARTKLSTEPHVTSPYGGFCPLFEWVETPGERVRIAPGVGQDWTLSLDARGLLQGRLTEGP